MRYLLLLVVAVLLAGCATSPERPAASDPQAAWLERQLALASIDSFELRGRLALRRGDEGVQVSLNWLLEPDRQRLDLAGPFGGGRVRATETRQGAELRDSNNRIYRDISMRELLARRTGWWLPLDAFRFWVVGMPAPFGTHESEVDEYGRLKSLKQLGWKINFLEYTSVGHYELPRRLFIERNPAPAGDEVLEARIVIEQWTPNVGAPPTTR